MWFAWVLYDDKEVIMGWLDAEELRQVQAAELSAFPAPIPTQSVSSDEFMPAPQTEKQREFEARIQQYGNALARRQGMSRRAFFKTAAGMAAAFVAMNDTYGPLYDASIAEAAERFRRIEAEGAGPSDRPDRSPARGCEMRLAGVLDERDAVTVGDRTQPRHVRSLPVQMYRNDRGGPRRDGRLDSGRIDCGALVVHIHEDRRTAGHQDREAGEGGGHRGRNDLITGTNPERTQRERNRIGSVADTDGMTGASHRGELGLERRQLGTEHEPPARHDSFDCLTNRRRVGARRQREKRHACHRRSPM